VWHAPEPIESVLLKFLLNEPQYNEINKEIGGSISTERFGVVGRNPSEYAQLSDCKRKSIGGVGSEHLQVRKIRSRPKVMIFNGKRERAQDIFCQRRSYQIDGDSVAVVT